MHLSLDAEAWTFCGVESVHEMPPTGGPVEMSQVVDDAVSAQPCEWKRPWARGAWSRFAAAGRL